MNRIIAASALADLLASEAHTDRQQTEAFIREYFSTIHQALASGDDVHIKGFGSFVLTGDETSPIRFEPAPEMKSVVNAPFEMFEPTPLQPGDVIETPPAAPVAESTPTPPVAPITPPDNPVTPSEVPEDCITPPEAPETHTEEPVMPPEIPVTPPEEPGIPPTPSHPENDEPVSTFIPPYNPVDYGYEAEVETVEEKPGFFNRGPRWVWALIALLIGLCIGAVAGFLYGLNSGLHIQSTMDENDADEIFSMDEEDLDEPYIISVDSLPVDTESADIEDSELSDSTTVSQEAAPAVEINTENGTYDTVTRTVFLTTLARRHYGQMEYWVYIYDANPNLGNPNKLEPGTRVLIPDKSSLPLTGDTDADIAAAKRRSAEIYARYNSK